MVFSLLLLANACTEERIDDFSPELEKEFFPLQIGRSWIYEADSIIFDPQTDRVLIDTVHFQIRETITDTFTNNINNLQFKIRYEERREGQSQWQLKNTYSAFTEDNRAIKSENNLELIKLTFPLRENERWKSTAFIDERATISIAGEPIEVYKGWESLIIARQNNYQLEDFNFEEAITVQLANMENILELRRVEEVYAKNVGLVFQEWQIFDSQCQVCCSGNLGTCTDVPWEQKAERGFILRKKLVDF